MLGQKSSSSEEKNRKNRQNPKTRNVVNVLMSRHPIHRDPRQYESDQSEDRQKSCLGNYIRNPNYC